VALAVLVGACGAGTHRRATPGPAPASTTTTAPPPQRASLDTGAALTIAVGPAPSNWNELSSAGAASDPGVVTGAVLPSVFTVQPDYRLALNANLVTSATRTGTGPQTVVYRINPKAVWSDGVAITWADFAYNWRAQSGQARFRDTGGRPFSAASTVGYRDIISVAPTGGDPDVVTVVFSAAFADWPSLFADMVPAHVAARVGFDTGFTDPVDDVVSGGPFLVEGYQAGRSLTLVRNARWWGTPASLSSVTFDFVTEPAVAATALGRGEVGALSLPPSAGLVAAVDSLADVKVGVASGPQWEELTFNQAGPSGPGGAGASPWMADPALRQALMAAVDRTQLIAATVGAYAPSTTPLGNRLFIPAEAAYVDNSGGRYDHADLAGARAALAQAGYTVVGGVLTRSGRAVTLRIAATPSPLHDAEERSVVAAASQLGIAVTVVPAAPGPVGGGAVGDVGVEGRAAGDLSVVDRMASPNLAGEVAVLGDPNVGGQSELSGANDPTLQAVLARAGASFNPTLRARLYNQVDAALWQAADSLPLFQLPTLLAYQQRYVGVVADPAPGGPIGALARWGVEEGS